MTKVQPETRLEIEQLVTELLWRLDNGHADRMWELYADDCVSEGPMGTMRGRGAIKAWGEKRVKAPASVNRHFIGGIRLAWSGGELHGTIQYVTYRDSQENPLIPASMGEFHEAYTQVNGEWRIARRKVVPIFGGANAASHAKKIGGGAK